MQVDVVTEPKLYPLFWPSHHGSGTREVGQNCSALQSSIREARVEVHMLCKAAYLSIAATAYAVHITLCGPTSCEQHNYCIHYVELR